MRMEQRMKLAPHMIQSMEILQLPILALQERIEQELNNNPVLELAEPSNIEQSDSVQEQPQEDTGERDLVVDTDNNKARDFERLEGLDDGYKDYMGQAGSWRVRRPSDEPDKKLEAMNNTADKGQSLHEYLTEQWRFVDADEKTKDAGQLIIDYIDTKGYLKVRLDNNEDVQEFLINNILKKKL